MRLALALPFLAVGCAQPVSPGLALGELPVLPGTTDCDGAFDSGPSFVCRQMAVDRVEAIFEYQTTLLQQGWRAALENGRESNFPSAPHGASEALWFERPVSSDCSEVVSVHVSSIETPEQDNVVGMFFLTGYEPACGSGRTAR